MSANELVDLNSANAAQLMSLPGIGPGLAARIIAYRTEHPINTAAQLAAIPGISPRMAGELIPLVLLTNESDDNEEVAAEEMSGGDSATEDTAAEDTAAEDTATEDTATEIVPDEDQISEELNSQGEEASNDHEEAVSADSIVEPTDAAEDELEEESALDEALSAAADWRDAALDAVGLGSVDDAEAENEGTGDSDSDLSEDTTIEEVEYSPSRLEALPLFDDSADDPPPPVPEFEPEVEPEPIFTAPPEPTPPAANGLANDIPSLLQLTGCRGTMLALFGGAIFGTLLTLLLLFVFNGGLRFADLDQVNNLADEQDALQDELRELEGELATAESSQSDLEENLADAATEQENLQATIGVMETRVENVGPAAERLDTFIVGMREFLNELATPPRPTMTPFATATDAVEDEATITPSSPDATRTPRPTSTPIATSTP